MSVESHGGMIQTGKTEELEEKTCPSATLSTTNPTWNGPAPNSGLRSNRPVTNCLSYSTASDRTNIVITQITPGIGMLQPASLLLLCP
jgi:hypothetical protein